MKRKTLSKKINVIRNKNKQISSQTLSFISVAMGKKSRKTPYQQMNKEVKVSDPFDAPILPKPRVQHVDLVIPWKDATEKQSYQQRWLTGESKTVVSAFKSLNQELFVPSRLSLVEMIHDLPPELVPMAKCLLSFAHLSGTELTAALLMQLAEHQETTSALSCET